MAKLKLHLSKESLRILGGSRTEEILGGKYTDGCTYGGRGCGGTATQPTTSGPNTLYHCTSYNRCEPGSVFTNCGTVAPQ